MPVFQAPNPPLAPASQTGPTVTSQVASTGNTGASLSSARADHAHAASVDSLRTPPLAVTGTSATFDIALYNNLEWVLPTAPLTGEQVDALYQPTKLAYYVTLTVAYTSPNTSQRPSGTMSFKQPASGQIAQQIRIATPAWAAGGVKGITTVTPTDATGKTLAQGGSCPGPYQALNLIDLAVDNTINPGTGQPYFAPFFSQIYEVDFHPLYDGTNWTLVFGTVANAAGGGIRLAGGAPYTVGGGGSVQAVSTGSAGLSLQAQGDFTVIGSTTVNSLSYYGASGYRHFADSYFYRYPRTAPTISPTTPSTGIDTYFIPDNSNSVWEWQLPNTANVGLSFPATGFALGTSSVVNGDSARFSGYILVRQPTSGQVVNSIAFYFLAYTYATSGAIRGVTTVSSPPDPNRPDVGDGSLTTTLSPSVGTVLRDPMSPDLNPQRGFGAVTIYRYQYVFDGGRWYVLVNKLPGLPIAAGNPASLTPVASATTSQSLVVDSTGMPVWADRVPRVCTVYAVGLANVNLAATTAPTIDGATQAISTTFYYLLTAQTAPAENGLWQAVTNGSGVPTWTRRASIFGSGAILDLSASIVEMGLTVTVSNGSTRASTSWATWMTNGGTLGSSAVYTLALTQPTTSSGPGLLASTDLNAVLSLRQAVTCATTSNVTLTGGAPSTVDGVALSLNTRVLVKSQTTGSQNGLYTVTTLGTGGNGTWTRAIDANTTGQFISGQNVYVRLGTLNAGTEWTLTTADPITVDSTSLTYALPAVATQSIPGLMSAADKVVTDSVNRIQQPKLLRSPLPVNLQSPFTLVSNNIHWVYLGQVNAAITVKNVWIYNSQGVTGTMTKGEFALGSTPLAGGNGVQAVTCTYVYTAPSFTTQGTKSSGAISSAVSAGTHLWAGIKIAMSTATQPTVGALFSEGGLGFVISTTLSAGTSITTTTYAAGINAIGDGSTSWNGPDLCVLI